MIPFGFFPEELKPRLQAQGFLMLEPAPLQVLSEEQAMKLAIQEAYRGMGFVSPNPLVGCVILDSQNRFLSKGYHSKYGGAHAEVHAVQQLTQERLRGARVFVTLEPCAHEGKTPSCAKALARLPLQEVVYGLVDPNPLVSGQGAEILRQAGIRVRRFEKLQLELESVCEHFLWNFREKKIFVTAKVASSLDGQMALANGQSQWITNEASRKVAHALRAAHDAILVGANTILTDNPSLNVRLPGFEKKKMKVIVLDSEGRCLSRLSQLKISQVHDPKDIIFAVSDRTSIASTSHQGEILQLPLQTREPAEQQPDLGESPGLDLKILLSKLGDIGLKSLFIEGGARVLSSFLRQKLVQRLYLFQAPVILGAKGGKGWTEQVKILSMDQKIHLKNLQTVPLQGDLLLTGQLQG